MKRRFRASIMTLSILAMITGAALAAYGRPELQALWQQAYALCR